jgi:hypothetical protein
MKGRWREKREMDVAGEGGRVTFRRVLKHDLQNIYFGGAGKSVQSTLGGRQLLLEHAAAIPGSKDVRKSAEIQFHGVRNVWGAAAAATYESTLALPPAKP